MIEYIILILLAFLTGALVKYSDYLEDTKKEKNKTKLIILGLFYGILIFLMVYYFPVVAPLWIGTTLGLILFGKIDALSHNIGVATALALSIAFAPGFLGWFLVLFVIVNIVEELTNDYFDKHKLKNKTLRTISTSRPLLEISAFLVSLIIFEWKIWIAILFFDIAYQVFTIYENNHPQTRIGKLKKLLKKRRK